MRWWRQRGGGIRDGTAAVGQCRRSSTIRQGYDAFIPLIDSGISLCVWTARRFLTMVMFTCRSFDTGEALRFTRNYFALSESEHQQF